MMAAQHKDKIRIAIKRWHDQVGHSAETREKISQSLKGRYTGTESPRFKIDKNKCSDCHIHIVNIYADRCRECYVKNNRGDKHYKYNGQTPLRKQIRGCSLYAKWRSDVFKRDKWTCQTCGERGCFLEAHHIKSFRLIFKENEILTTEQAFACTELWDLHNGVTLCKDCHKLTRGK